MCVGLTTLEVVVDILLPFITALIIDRGLEAGDLSAVYRYGAIMVLMAFFGLLFGAAAGRHAARVKGNTCKDPGHKEAEQDGRQITWN